MKKYYDEKFLKMLKIVGKRIKSYRIQKNLTIMELSNETKIRMKYLEKIECGEAVGVEISYILLILKRLNVSPKEFF